MKTYPPCPNCGRSMVSRSSPVPAGMVRYGGHGLCNACLERQSRHGPTPALPFDARPWVEQAACAEVGGDDWFPEKGGDLGRRAKAVCRVCPVREPCLDYSLTNDEVFGVWGGLSPMERFKLRRTA